MDVAWVGDSRADVARADVAWADDTRADDARADVSRADDVRVCVMRVWMFSGG